MKTNYALLIVAAILVIGGLWYLASARPGVAPAPETAQNSQTPETAQNVNDTGAEMSFFLTSVNPGRGGDLGGLSGADAYCQTLAETAGAGDRLWRAYLSAAPTSNSATVNARDRIGTGPWYNYSGTLIAEDLAQLHNGNGISKENALTEKGGIVNGRGDDPNRHDILTGSDMDGRFYATSTDSTCDNWTEDNDEKNFAMVGHHDRVGLREDAPSRSWNASHLSRGCSLEALAASGGAGLFYCFAAD